MKVNLKTIIVVILALASVSFCSDEEKALKFMKHIVDHAKEGEGSVEFWTKKIYDEAKDHEEEAKAFATINVRRGLLGLVKRNLNSPLAAVHCSGKVNIIRAALLRLHRCK